MDGQEHRERTEGETGDLGKRGNGQKDWTPKSWYLGIWGGLESGDRCLGLGWVAVGRAGTVDALNSLGT